MKSISFPGDGNTTIFSEVIIFLSLFQDGRLHAGDQLLGADGHSFIGISEDQLRACVLIITVVVTRDNVASLKSIYAVGNGERYFSPFFL